MVFGYLLWKSMGNNLSRAGNLMLDLLVLALDYPGECALQIGKQEAFLFTVKKLTCLFPTGHRIRYWLNLQLLRGFGMLVKYLILIANASEFVLHSRSLHSRSLTLK